MLEAEVPEDIEHEITPAARTWINQNLRPKITCFKKHHDGDIERFQATWEGVIPSNFKCWKKNGAETCRWDGENLPPNVQVEKGTRSRPRKWVN